MVPRAWLRTTVKHELPRAEVAPSSALANMSVELARGAPRSQMPGDHLCAGRSDGLGLAWTVRNCSSDCLGSPACCRSNVSLRFEPCEEIQQADDATQKQDGGEDAGNQVPHVHPRTHPGPTQQVLSEHGVGPLTEGRFHRVAVPPVRFVCVGTLDTCDAQRSDR